MENKNEKSSIGNPSKDYIINLLKWIGFIPMAILGAWGTWFIYRATINYAVGVDPSSFWGKFLSETASQFIMGAMFIYIGARIVPKYKKAVALIFTILITFITAFSFYYFVSIEDYWGIFGVVATVLGAGIITYYINQGEIDLEN